MTTELVEAFDDLQTTDAAPVNRLNGNPNGNYVSTVRDNVDVQITTARRYPRSIKAFKTSAMSMATIDEETAAGCWYSVPRDGKKIEGASIRLAEIVLSAWGNIRAESAIIEVADKHLVAEGTCWDLETNTAVKVQVRRRIIGKTGRRYSDDMIVTTGNAACAIALRNAVFKVVPMVYVKSIEREARRVAIGDVKTLAKKRDEMVVYFGKMGVDQARVLSAVERPGIEDVTLDDLATLKGLATAIRDGETTIEEAFPVERQAVKQLPTGKESAEHLTARLGQKKAAEPQPAADTGERMPVTEVADLMAGAHKAGLDGLKLAAFLKENFGPNKLACDDLTPAEGVRLRSLLDKIIEPGSDG